MTVPDPATSIARLAELSPRERQCLRMTADGWEAKEIARTLGISAHTVKNHLGAARAKLGVARSIDAARLVRAEEAAAVAVAGSTGPPVSGSPRPGPSLPGPSLPGPPWGIADRRYDHDDDHRLSEPAEAADGLRDVAWRPAAGPSDWPLPFPTRRGQRNELGLGARLAMVVMLTVLLIAAVGFFVQASRGLDF